MINCMNIRGKNSVMSIQEPTERTHRIDLVSVEKNNIPFGLLFSIKIDLDDYGHRISFGNYTITDKEFDEFFEKCIWRWWANDFTMKMDSFTIKHKYKNNTHIFNVYCEKEWLLTFTRTYTESHLSCKVYNELFENHKKYLKKIVNF